jgi:hypothetical protein
MICSSSWAPWGGWECHAVTPCEFSYLLTYVRSWALLEKLPVVQPLKKLTAFYGIWRFIAVLTRALQWFLSWDRSIESTPSHPISLRCILILKNVVFWDVALCRSCVHSHRCESLKS